MLAGDGTGSNLYLNFTMTELTLIIPAKKETESLPQVIAELKFIDSKTKVKV